MNTNGEFELSIPYDNSYNINGHSLFYHPSHDANLEPKTSNGWIEVDMEGHEQHAKATASGSGIYVVTEGPVNVAAAVLIPMFLVGLLGGGGYAYWKHTKGEIELPCLSGGKTSQI